MRLATAICLALLALVPATASARFRAVGPEYVATVKGTADLDMHVKDSIHEHAMEARISWRTRIYEIYVKNGKLVNPTYGESPMTAQIETTYITDDETLVCSGTARRPNEISRLKGRRVLHLRPFETAGGVLPCAGGRRQAFNIFSRGGGYDASFKLPRLKGRKRVVVKLQSAPNMPIERCLGDDPRRDDPTAQATCSLTWNATATFTRYRR